MRNSTFLLSVLFLLLQTTPNLSAQNPGVDCDTVLVVAQATGGFMTCTAPFATLTGAQHPTALGYQWTGPGGFTSTERVTSWYKPGTYILTVTGPYGCTAQTAATIADSCTFYPLIPPECPDPYVPPADDCNNVCVRQFLPAYYWFSNVDALPGPPIVISCLIQVHNDQWFAFVAGATSGSITVESANCAYGDGIQLALLDECGGEVIACNGGMPGGANQQITIFPTNLIIGKVYYLLVDGYVGDLCEYQFIIDGNICNAPAPSPFNPKLNGISKVCPNAATTYEINSPPNATAFLWTAPPGSTINGMPSPVVLYTPNGKSVDIVFGDQPGFVAVRALYYFYPPSPPLAIQITMEPIPPTVLPVKKVCAEELPFVWDEEPYPVLSSTGTFNLTSTPYQSYLGCDSIVKQTVIISPLKTTNLGTITRCNGDCFNINGSTYCESGSYTEVLQSYEGCDSIVNFSLLILNPIAEITGNNLLTCGTPVVTLGSAPSAGQKRWQNANGQVIGLGNTLTVSMPGLFILTTTVAAAGGSCTKSDTIVVVQDISPVQVLISSGGSLTCTTPNLTLSGSTIPAFASVKWTGPNGFTSTVANPVVSATGVYPLTATNPINGCTGTATTTVSADQTPPVIAASGDTVTCTQLNITLSGVSNNPDVIFEWTGPGGFYSQLPNPETGLPGPYTLTVTGMNGCTATATAEVFDDQIAPTVSAVGGILTCTEPAATLQANADLSSAGYVWLGPNGFFSTLPDPEVNVAGSYTVTVTAANGCTGTDIAELVADQDPPLVEAQGGTLTCSQSQIALSGVTGSIFDWTGPDGFYSQEPNPVVEKTGIYTLTVTAMNGCEGTATAEVTADLNAPTALAMADTLDCTNISANLYGTSDVPGASFHWTGPNGFESDLQNPQAGQAGVYLLTVTNPANGCTEQTQAEMVAVLDVPGINVIQLSPQCGDSLLFLDASSPLPGAMFSWTGPNGFTAQTEDVQVTAADWYRVKAVAPNGCSSEIQILAVPAPPIPQVSIFPQMPVLSCLTPVISLTASADIAGCTFDWSFPGAPNIPQPGIYQVTATSPDGCTATAQVTVDQDIAAPELSAQGGVLTCAQPTTFISATSATPGAVITWYGNGFPTTQNPALVSEPGMYTAVATAPNGCTSSVTVIVVDSCLLISTKALPGSDANNIIVYPNPGDGIVYVKSLNGTPVSAVVVYRIDGVPVRREMPVQAVDLLQFDWSELPAAVYVVSVLVGDRWVNKPYILIE